MKMFLLFLVSTVKGSLCFYDLSRTGIASSTTEAQKLLEPSMKSVWSDFVCGLKFCEPFVLSVELSQFIVEVKQAWQ